MPKIVPKLSKRVLNKFWGNFSEKNFCPVFHGWSSLRNVFKKSKIFQNFIIAQNRSQKCPNVFWTCFEVIFPKKIFAQCSMEGRVFEMFFKKSKNFQNFIIAQNRSQKCPNAFWTCFEVIFSKIFFAQCSMDGRVFEMFSKNQKFFKIS